MRARRRRITASAILSAAACAAALAHPVAAQGPQGAVEVGAARLRQRDAPQTDAVTMGATLRHEDPRYALAAAGAVTLGNEGSTSQGLLGASLFGRPDRPTRWEIGGALTAFGQNDLPLTAGAYLLAREHLALRSGGGWAGVGIGGVEDLDRWYPTRIAEIGSWFRTRAARLTAAALLVDTRSDPYVSGSGLVTDPVTYTDAFLSARREGRRLELEARGGLRLISRGALTPTGRGTRPFASVDAAFWITPRIALVGALGRQLSDLARGTPDTRFAALSLRVALNERTAPATARRASAAPVPRAPGPEGARPQLTLARDSTSAARVIITITAADANRVELAASFTGWEPVALVRMGDAWQLDRLVPPGTHRVLVRIDGGPWLVPVNLPATADDFGGTVGLLTVP